MKKLLYLLVVMMFFITPSVTSLSIDKLITNQPQTETVYVTKTGEKYHRSGCQYLQKSKIETTKQKAINNGYSACSRCKP